MNHKHLNSLVKNPKLAIVGILSLPCFRFVPDDLWLKITYRCRTGLKLDLEHPIRFNEKLQWLKLYDRQPEYTILVDKFRVRNIIKERIGSEYLIPLLGAWDEPKEINFDELPAQFVLKCNHSSGGGIYICRNRSELNIDKAKKVLQKGLNEDYFLRGREWPYKEVPRKIICEEYIEDCSGKGLTDYKFMCFNGEPKLVFTCTNRTSMGCNVTFFDMEWNKLPFERHYPSDPNPVPKPVLFDEMVDISRKLSAGIPFVRVDLYEAEGKVYFGELTLYPGCGFEKFRPDEVDTELGNMIKL